MKVLILGGCGQEGKTTVRDLVTYGGDTTVLIADINLAAAQQFEAELASDKVSTVQLDVNQRDDLARLMTDADVVVNFVGPFYKYGIPVLETAIETRSNFVDICDDYDATSAMLELDSKAKDAGITALIGMGASPGVTNLLAKHGADKLDRVDDIEMKWMVSVADVDDVGTSAAMDHAMHMIDGNVPQFLEGRLQNVPALSGVERMTVPVLGESEIYYVGHPEPVTLPRYIDGLTTCTNKGGVPGLDDVLRMLSTLGLTGVDPIEVRGTALAPKDIAIALLGNMPEPDPDELPPPMAAVRVCVRGLVGDEASQYTYDFSGRMTHWTGVPASIGILMVGNGEVTTRGVMAPEGCLDTEKFLTELARRDLRVQEVEQRTHLIE